METEPDPTAEETPWPQRRAAVSAARAALSGVAEALWAARGGELAEFMTELDDLVVRASAARVAVAAEADARGEIDASQCAGVRGWVEEHAPSTRAAGGAGVIARLVKDLTENGRRGRELAGVRAAVLDGALAPSVAVTVIDQFAKLAPRLADGVGPTVLEHMIDIGGSFGSRGVRDLRRGLIAQFGAPGELDRIEESNRRFIDLSPFASIGDGVWQAGLTVDSEGKAVIEAAIGPLSRPAPLRDEHNQILEPDTRTAGQRRGQALIEVCRRVTSAAATPSPGGMKTALYVTMSLTDLQDRCEPARPSAPSAPETSSRPNSSGVWPAMPASSPSSSARPASRSTSAAPNDSSHPA